MAIGDPRLDGWETVSTFEDERSAVAWRDELRDGKPFRHLRAVAGDTGVDSRLAGDADAAARRR